MCIRVRVINTLQEARLSVVLSDSESLGVPEALPCPQISAETWEGPDFNRDPVMVSLGVSLFQTSYDSIRSKEKSHK